MIQLTEEEFRMRLSKRVNNPLTNKTPEASVALVTYTNYKSVMASIITDACMDKRI